MKDEEKTIGEKRADDAKGKGEKTFGVKISFLGEYLIEVKAADYRDACSMLEGETNELTEEILEQAIRLDIGKAEINDMLEISVLELVSIEAD